MSSSPRDVFIVAYGRSAIGKSGKRGALREMHPVDIGGIVLQKVLEKLPSVPAEAYDDVIVGCSSPYGTQGINIARLIARRASLPYEVSAMTVNRHCSSGLQAIDLATIGIQAGRYECAIAGGIESMSTVPMGTDRSLLNKWLLDNDIGYYHPMGMTAEAVGDRYGITRQEMDEFAVESHRRASAAQEAGKFDDEIIALNGIDESGNEIVFDKDQGIRKDTTLEVLSTLKTPFKENGKVTAGTSSQTSDGTGFVVLMSKEATEKYNIKPIARFVDYTVAGCAPDVMGIGPIYAIPKLMKRVGMTVGDMDVIELNEAFAAQAIPCIRELGLDTKKVNPNGGAIAMGHPLGATGAVLVCKALAELKRTGGKYGLISMCIGGGMGAAGIVELIT